MKKPEINNAVAPDWNLKQVRVHHLVLSSANAVAPDWNLKQETKGVTLRNGPNAVAPDWNLKFAIGTMTGV